ncbi:MAG: XRE family transcriptional regulator [Candidatus Wallbacteria bacterium]|nr:XRE family transcriptional regulator [Candidatus Wallbacteria bacterium]
MHRGRVSIRLIHTLCWVIVVNRYPFDNNSYNEVGNVHDLHYTVYMKYFDTIGKILLRERTRNKLSLVDVENLSSKKIDRAYLSRVENGIVPPSQEMLDILIGIYKSGSEVIQAIEILFLGSKQKVKCKFIPKQRLEIKAVEALVDCFGSTVSFPVDVDALAGKHGYEILKKDLTELFDEDFFCLLIPEGRNYFGLTKKIVVNSRVDSLRQDMYSPRMQRMSVAHEISHIALGHKDTADSPPLFTRLQQEYEDYEWQASYLAGALLMPLIAVEQFLAGVKSVCATIVEDKEICIDREFEIQGSSYTILPYLMNLFDVSKSAIETRLGCLGYKLRFSSEESFTGSKAVSLLTK